MQKLERMMEQGKAEHAQLRAERDTLADCVRGLQELQQQQPPAPTDTLAQVIVVWDDIASLVPCKASRFAGRNLQKVTGMRA